MVLTKRTLPVTEYLIGKYYEVEKYGAVLEDKSNDDGEKLEFETTEAVRDSDVEVSPEPKYEEIVAELRAQSNRGLCGEMDNDNRNTTSNESYIAGWSRALLTTMNQGVKYVTGKDLGTWRVEYQLKKKRQLARSYDDWKDISLQLDELTGKTKWKTEEESDLYDYKAVKELTLKMRQLREAEAYPELLYYIRTKWTRNFGNMGNVNLYRHTNHGTKKLIEEYLAESKLCIETLVSKSGFENDYLLGILQQTRRNIGKSALVLSGGATFGLFHIGVLAALFEADLIPRVISGTSAGAIVASIFCTHTTDEIPGLLENVLHMKFNIFWGDDDDEESQKENALVQIARFFKHGTWFDNKHLVDTMIRFLGDLTFREAYNRTGKILNISVSTASIFEQPRLLNNLTAPNVLIWSAVCASCAVPGIFPTCPLYEKDPTTGEKVIWGGSKSVRFMDGSVDNDLPISRLSEMFNVDHIIACQVNLHVYPFLKLSVSCVGGELQNESSARIKQHITKLCGYISDEMVHYLEILSEMGVAVTLCNKIRSVLSQQYSGNVTILPKLNMASNIDELLKNPTQHFLLKETTLGARATWPNIPFIRSNCTQEFILDKAIAYLKEQIIVSSSTDIPKQISYGALELVKLSNDPKKQNQEKKKTDDSFEDHYVLDDNLIENEPTNSTLLLRENAYTTVHHPLSANDNYLAPVAKKRRNHRKSEASTRHRSRYAVGSCSFSAGSTMKNNNTVHFKGSNSVSPQKIPYRFVKPVSKNSDGIVPRMRPSFEYFEEIGKQAT
ncbi:Triacylglycerol lipase 5 [Nakaseomyces bracarensis]|uniref:Patatin-like phospholipase domain-containing protein n=1 Tax=Nakaseomyces bracarensis TaxID=273131 RepID=A0ABR4NMQ8_9SACH